MKTLLTATLLAFTLNSAHALSKNEISCSVWKDAEGEPDKTQTIEMGVNRSRYDMLSGTIAGSLKYQLTYNPENGLATLRVFSGETPNTIRKSFKPGETIGWREPSDWDGEPKILCKRGGKYKVKYKTITKATCKKIHVEMSGEIGRTPIVRNFGKQTASYVNPKEPDMYWEAEDYYEGSKTVSTVYDKKSRLMSFYMDEMSVHVVDAFDFSVTRGDTVKIRMQDSSSYDDYICKFR